MEQNSQHRGLWRRADCAQKPAEYLMSGSCKPDLTTCPHILFVGSAITLGCCWRGCLVLSLHFCSTKLLSVLCCHNSFLSRLVWPFLHPRVGTCLLPCSRVCLFSITLSSRLTFLQKPLWTGFLVFQLFPGSLTFSIDSCTLEVALLVCMTVVSSPPHTHKNETYMLGMRCGYLEHSRFLMPF